MCFQKIHEKEYWRFWFAKMGFSHHRRFLTRVGDDNHPLQLEGKKIVVVLICKRSMQNFHHLVSISTTLQVTL